MPRTALAGDDLKITVKKGEALISPADTYLANPGDSPKLQLLDRIADPKRLVPGSSMRDPPAWMHEEPGQVEVMSVADADELADPRVTIPRPAQGGYFVRVRAIGPDGSGRPFAAHQRFMVINRVAGGPGANLFSTDGQPVRLH